MEVYFALNRTNGKGYVGWTKTTAGKRFRQHCKEARSSRCCYYFHKAIRKYGADAFDVLTVYKGDDAEEMKQVEMNYIAGMRTNNMRFGYNLTAGGEGTKEHVVSDATRKLRRERMLGASNPMANPEYRDRVSEALKGRQFSDEWKKRLKRPRTESERRAATEKKKAWCVVHPEEAAARAMHMRSMKTR